MSLQKQEEKMLKEIEARALTRHVEHRRWREKYESDSGKIGTRDITFSLKRKNGRCIELMGVTTVRIMSGETCVGEGRAYCSVLEKSYSKRRGRVIATGRALKNAKAGEVKE